MKCSVQQTMSLASHYVVMFFWSAVCVRPQDPLLLNPTNAASTPCKFIQPGDLPHTKCGMEMHCYTVLMLYTILFFKCYIQVLVI